MKVKPKFDPLKAIKAIFDVFSPSPTRMYQPRPPIKRTGPGTMPVYVEEEMTDDQISEDIKHLSKDRKPYANVPFDIQ